MNFEKIFGSDPEEESISNPEKGKKTGEEELEDLGIEVNQENLETLIDQQKTEQQPSGYENILDNLDNPEELKGLMEKEGLTSVVHSEGRNVWEHSRAAIKEVDSMDIPEEEKNDLKLIMLYHDLGKTEAVKSEKNKEQTRKKLEKGELFQTMIGHEKERLDDIRKGFQANGIEGEKLKRFMVVVENHMNTSLLEQDPKKTVKLFQEFGEDEEEIKNTVKLLVNVVQADGNATEKIELKGGELRDSKNDKKLNMSFNDVWEKYKEGKKILQQEKEKQEQKKKEEEQEKEIFGKKLSGYLKDWGVKEGPDMGRCMKEVKNIIKENEELSPDQLKEEADKKIKEFI